MFEGTSARHWTWIGALLVAPSFLAAGGCGTDPISMGTGDSGAGGTGAVGGTGGSSPIACPDSACGPQLGIANYQCWDGSTAGPTGRCLKNASDGCSWEVRSCPPSTGGAGGMPNAGGAGGADPCAGKALPECKACTDGAVLSHCGEACSAEGESCSSPIGDVRTCTMGSWECVVHTPLSQGCNLVCRDPGSGGAGGSAGSGGAAGSDCNALLADMNAKLATAQACNPASAKPAAECQGSLDGSCCPVAVENADPTSPANQAYLNALQAYKQACKYACPAIACFTPTPGNCMASSSSTSGVCAVGNGL